ncbi:MAG: hypothetical protein HY369_00455 [Candidatus Aenigmarchaeota archaeon]|nr:hypothetical protein [Candidatus Aenigmarchaeota archaeon]
MVNYRSIPILSLVLLSSLGADEEGCTRPEEVKASIHVSARDKEVSVDVDVINKRPPPTKKCTITEASIHIEGGVKTVTETKVCEQ